MQNSLVAAHSFMPTYVVTKECLRAGRSGDQIVLGGEIFRTSPDRPWGPPNFLYNEYRVFPGGKERPRRDVDPSPPSSAVGHERVELYLHCPYGPYGLYRASVPVQGCTLLLLTFTAARRSVHSQKKVWLLINNRAMVYGMWWTLGDNAITNLEKIFMVEDNSVSF